MQKLNFPDYSFRFKNSENKIAVFDEIRKKFVILTPEEWVRLNTVQYLKQQKKYPTSLINVEKQVKIGKIVKRYDIVVFNSSGEVHLVVECKAPEITITQATFDQIARYNMKLNAQFLMVTNGLQHYVCQMDYQKEKYNFLPQLPDYDPIQS
ncbi:type I restriction enzyme HsdR N-terminal domain-containing protein [Antarcticibacterium sp. 1MA-6-2]|uniref:type I restriction enzyme HsdR N-terminal domain-containing protein n=1 Tax=Antarcticibacterium sp. 1MA-6-2 TaxID=2908210 RepID=UPI001F3F437E|nr:type I restriction enzyme HsdR N-terminal domain-containing protein [Antarcticibacterium sp. 1MA-6-2]UJH92275.1 type I restriction enzyme HsdR N-terminal domain-containing protein [Antarcticibacterium sp. 1MA-6-2]